MWNGGRGERICTRLETRRAQEFARRRLRHRYYGDPLRLLPADPLVPDRPRSRLLDRALGADPDGRAVDPEAARLLRLPDGAARRDAAAARAQHRDDAAHSVERARGRDGRRLHHRRLLAPGDERRLRHRPHRLLHPNHGELPRHHQGRDAYRRGRRALHARCHPRQADGDRRRSQRRSHQRQAGASAPPRARRGELVLRLDGRCLEVRARRRRRRHHHPRGQHLRAASSSARRATA